MSFMHFGAISFKLKGRINNVVCFILFPILVDRFKIQFSHFVGNVFEHLFDFILCFSLLCSKTKANFSWLEENVALGSK